jgi:three-Cys-motif partner protein
MGTINTTTVNSTTNRFGGDWTEEKLEVLREYLGFYTQALKGKNFELVYIDTFAGTGRCQIRSDHGDRVIDGSAKIALDCSPAFSKYRFIEKKKAHAAELQGLIDTHPNGDRARVIVRGAADMLPFLLKGYDWASTRGVLFLDPYGLQCTWQMLQQIAATKALDVFFLVSLSGLFRQAAINEQAIDDAKATRLTQFLGTDEWRSALYINEQQDLFSEEPTVTRDRGYAAILQFVTKRLKVVFPYVSEPRLMHQRKGPPMFALYFAVANPSNKARALAQRVSNDILSKLR